MVLPVAYDSGYSAPWFAGVAFADSTIVPNTFPLAINGRPYLLNSDPQAIDSYADFFKELSLPLMRPQSDQSDEPGESSISPQQFWRRSQNSWHHGAGQSMLDRTKISDPERFNSSKGINPWTRYQLSLLKNTDPLRITANTNLFLAPITNGIAFANGTDVEVSTDLVSTVTATGGPGVAVTGMTTANGAQVYVGFGASGIYTLSGSVLTSYVTGTVALVGYAKGRLLVAGTAGQLYNPIAAGALPAAFYTHPDANWQWSAFAEGDAFIYAAGNNASSRQSRIYRIAVQADGVGLSAPITAATLPQGEIIRSMLGYLGFVIIGTDKGVRFATTNASGDLTLGALIVTNGPVNCLDPGKQFVWFGWSNYDALSSGLGRLDMTTINEGLAPAYASDLMCPDGIAQPGIVRGVTQLNDRRVFSIDGLGVFVESATIYSPIGTLTTGQIAYGISDPKVGIKVDLKHQPLAAVASVGVAVTLDRTLPAVTLGSSTALGSVSPAESISVGKRRAEEFELTFTLLAGYSAFGGYASVDTVLTRWTLLSYPAPDGASMYVLPIILAERITTLRDTDYPQDPLAEYQFLTDLHVNREICTIQVGSGSFEGILEDYVWIPHSQTHDRSWWNGTFVAKIRKLNG